MITGTEQSSASSFIEELQSARDPRLYSYVQFTPTCYLRRDNSQTSVFRKKDSTRGEF